PDAAPDDTQAAEQPMSPSVEPEPQAPDDDKPRFMTSAERRTTDDLDAPFGAGIFSEGEARAPASAPREELAPRPEQSAGAAEMAPIPEAAIAETPEDVAEAEDFDAFVDDALAEAVPEPGVEPEAEAPIDELQEDVATDEFGESEFLDMDLEDGEVP